MAIFMTAAQSGYTQTPPAPNIPATNTLSTAAAGQDTSNTKTETQHASGNPLFSAVKACDIVKTKKILSSRHAYNINEEDEAGQTALYQALGNGCTDVAQLLLDGGANINLQDKKGDTPLMAAAANGNADVVRLLIKHKANIGLENNSCETAFNVAQDTRHLDIVQMLSPFEPLQNEDIGHVAASQTIKDDNGSTITVADLSSPINGASVVIPIGALGGASCDTVTVGYADAPPGSWAKQANGLASKVISITRSPSHGGGQFIHSELPNAPGRFATPVTVTIPYDKNIGEKSNNKFYISAYWDNVSTTFPGIYVGNNGTVTFRVSELGWYAARMSTSP